MAATPFTTSSFWKQWAPLFGAGMIGIASLGPALRPLINKQRGKLPPQLHELSDAQLVAISSIQPAVLLGIAVAQGVALAPKLGFRSHIVAAATGHASLAENLTPELPVAVAVGTGCALAVLALDAASRPWMPPELALLAKEQPRTLGTTASGILYGGITEELLMRWGLLTLLTWTGTRVVGKDTSLSPTLVWSAITLTALIFGAGHLPATAAVAPLTGPLVARALVLNGLFGIGAGWLYWRLSLEAAMVAHATGHVVFALAAQAGLAD